MDKYLVFLTVHALVNMLSSIAAGYFLWHAWKTDRKAVRRFREIMEGTVKSRMEDAFKRVFHRVPDWKAEESMLSEITDRKDYDKYLQSLKGEFPLSFPEWKEARKEASHV